MRRYTYGTRNTTDEYSKTLTIVFLKRHGYLGSGISFQSGGLSWTINGEPSGNIGIRVHKENGEGYL